MPVDGGRGRTLLAQAVSAYPSLAAAVADGVRVGCGMGVCHQCEQDGVRTCLERTTDA